jgi:hypothetical protein
MNVKITMFCVLKGHGFSRAMLFARNIVGLQPLRVGFAALNTSLGG